MTFNTYIEEEQMGKAKKLFLNDICYFRQQKEKKM